MYITVVEYVPVNCEITEYVDYFNLTRQYKIASIYLCAADTRLRSQKDVQEMKQHSNDDRKVLTYFKLTNEYNIIKTYGLIKNSIKKGTAFELSKEMSITSAVGMNKHFDSFKLIHFDFNGTIIKI